jgi:nucleoside-diphosphate-sugar epimerase
MIAPRLKILVTGAGGFVGAEVVREALANGHNVVALVRSRNAARLTGLNIDIRIADLSDTPAVSAILEETRPDVVIHSAWEGVGGPNRAGDVQLDNIKTSVALADAAIAAGVAKFVGVGSQAEYGRFDRRIFETDLPNPSILYGAAKLAALHLIRQRLDAAGKDFAWLRIFSTYGPGDNPNWLIPSALAHLQAGQAPQLTAGTQTWDYLHVNDVARGIIAAAVTPAVTGTFNLSSGISTPVRAIIEYLRDQVAPAIELKFGEIPFGPAQIMRLEGDNSRLKDATGWAPQIGIFEGLKALAQPLQAAA